jgi:hypothetical protein
VRAAHPSLCLSSETASCLFSDPFSLDAGPAATPGAASSMMISPMPGGESGGVSVLGCRSDACVHCPLTSGGTLVGPAAAAAGADAAGIAGDAQGPGETAHGQHVPDQLSADEDAALRLHYEMRLQVGSVDHVESRDPSSHRLLAHD